MRPMSGRANRGRRRAASMVTVCLLAVSLPLKPGSPDARAAEPAVRRVTDDGYFKQRPAWSPDGTRLVFARHRGATIFLFLRETASGDEQRLTAREAPEYDAVFSPDGRELAFALDKTSPNQGDLEVYRLDLRDRSLHPVAVTEGKLSHEESPCWSPDGKQLAFTSTKEGNQELFTVPAGGGDWKRLTSDPAIDAHPAWSPDGKSIALATNRWGDLEIAVVGADGGAPRRITESRGLDDYPAWSPDGRFLAFVSNRDGNLEVYCVPSEGGPAVNVTRHPAIDNFPAWTPHGRIGFVSNRDRGFDIYTTAVAAEADDARPVPPAELRRSPRDTRPDSP